MNNGKICISLCSKTRDELFEKIARAEALADVIEVRFDCLEPSEVDRVLDTLPKITKQYLLTYRPKEQGGARELAIGTRVKFWSRALRKLRDHDFIADYEFDLDLHSSLATDRAIVSMHDFHPVGGALLAGFDDIWSMTGKTTKIAIAATSVIDAIPVWNMLKTAPKHGKQIIPIAMGEAGKWTRILGLARGAFMTYASLDSGSETAPGQISAEDMIDVFRVKELDKDTQVYGIIAGDTSYSASPWMHNAAFKAAGMNRVFIPLQVADLDEFITRMVRQETHEVELNFGGFSVTNPHKQSIIRHLDETDETAAKIGAVNTVKIDNGKLFGYNTDAPGFISPLKKKFGDLKDASAAVVGAGGAARAVIYALQEEGANVTLFARDINKASAVAEEFGIKCKKFEISDLRSKIYGADILVNATPLGTKGKNEAVSIAKAEQLNGVKLVYDLIYNPIDTLLIREANKAGVPAIGGLEMVIAQGAKQFEIWTGREAPIDSMTAAIKKKLNI